VQPEPPTTLMQVAVENVGVLRAGPALANLVTWCWSLQRHGPDMTPDQYADDWLVSVATAYRHRKAVLDAFEGVDLVQVAKLVDAHGKGRRTQRGALRVAGEIAPLRVVVER